MSFGSEIIFIVVSVGTLMQYVYCFYFCLFVFSLVLIPEIDGKIGKKNVNANIMARKLTGVNPKKYFQSPFSKCNARLVEANNYRKFQGDNPTLILNLMIVKC